MGFVARPLLIAKTGDTLETIRQQHGDFDWMFGRFVDGLEVLMIDAVRSPDALPAVDEIAAEKQEEKTVTTQSGRKAGGGGGYR